ncbi:sorting nexin-25-like isoform X1 [Acropora palmata]|uniref:sorting nexin-25-like isoform X1 n=1 Tax=Acropora palmata TaxID=6131 RepID=UPI003DA03C1C
MQIYLVAGCVLLLALLWQVGFFQGLLSTIWIGFVALLGISSGVMLCLLSGKQRIPPKPIPSPRVETVSRFLAELTQTHLPYKHKTLVSRPVDKTIQEVFDLFIRDFCLSWYRGLGKDETAFVDLLTEELWIITANIVERLKGMDTVKFLSNDVVEILSRHFQQLRLADTRNFSDNALPFVLHPCLKSRKEELDYLRKASEVLLCCLLPVKNYRCTMMRNLLREILAFSVFQPLTDTICDPDYINQTLLVHLEAKEALTAQHKQGYAYAETYEDFIKMINASNSVEALKQIRYHIIAEIMQATTINNLKGIDQFGQDNKQGKAAKKDVQLRARNLKRYINQCTVAKSQCERRIKLLGGPDYTNHRTAEKKLAGQEKVKASQKPSKTHSKVLSFNEVMENSLARSFFMLFLQNKTGSKNMLSFWMAVENLKLVKPTELHKSAQEIYEVYVAPSSDKSVKLDTTLIRGMEQFLNGTHGLQAFFEAQKRVFNNLEERFYRKFVLSGEYSMFVCQSEAEMDDLRAQNKDDDDLELNWNDEMDTTDEDKEGDVNGGIPKSGCRPSTVEERSDAIVNKLEILDQRLASKTHQLEIVRRSYGCEAEEMEQLEREIEKLKTERMQLEFHVERTDQWCENLGKWKIEIPSVEWNTDGERSTPVFAIVVHSTGDERGEMMREGDVAVSSEGWVVTRRFKDFETLHVKLKECCAWLSRELPVPSKKWYKSIDSDFLERSRKALEEYLQTLLADEKLCLSEELYSFLCPSPEHLKNQSEPTKKGFSLLSVLKSSLPFDITPTEEADEEIDQEDSTLRKDSIAEPFYGLIGEVFELKGVFKWLRRSLIAFVHVTSGGNINKEIHGMVEWLVSESMVMYYIHLFRDSMWPGGELAKPAAQRTDLEKSRTSKKARQKLLKNIPEILHNLVGKRNSKLGTIKVFEALQDIRVTKHLFYVLFELIILTLCPEVMSDEVRQKAKLMQSEHQESLLASSDKGAKTS